MVRDRKWVRSTRPNQPIGKTARRALKARFSAVVHYLPLAAKQADTDVEYVHQLRVATRRAVAVMQVFGDLLPKERTRKLRKELQRVRRAAGDARDLDVLCERLLEQIGRGPDRRLEAVLRAVRRRRKRAQKPLREVHARLKRRCFKRQTVQLIDRVRQRKTGAEPTLAETAQSMLRPVADEFFAAAVFDTSDLDALHRMRISGKRLRYTMELLAGAFDASFRKDLYSLVTEIQQRLGAINDQVTTRRLFSQWDGEGDDPLEVAGYRELSAETEREFEAVCRAFCQWWSPEKLADLQRRFDAILPPTCGQPSVESPRTQTRRV